MRTTSLFALAALAVASLVTGLPTFGKTAELADADLPPALRGPDRLLKIELAPRLPDHPNVDKLRGPCPFLNTAANHGLLPYNGRNISLPLLHKLIGKMGLSELMVKGFIAGAEMVLKTTKKPVLDLTDLNVPHEVAHDLALTKHDVLETKFTQAAFRPSAKLVNGMIDMAKQMSGHPDKGPHYITYASISAWRKKRYEMEIQRKLPDGTAHKPKFSGKFVFIGIGEAGLILHVLGEGGKIRTDIAESILLHETFPAGWKPHVVSTIGLVNGINRALIGYYTPDFVLKWFGKWEAPAAEPDVAAPATDEDNNKAESTGYVQKIINTLRWAVGDTAACADCTEKKENPLDK